MKPKIEFVSCSFTFVHSEHGVIEIIFTHTGKFRSKYHKRAIYEVTASVNGPKIGQNRFEYSGYPNRTNAKDLVKEFIPNS